jgi:hypothetical protein
MVSFSGMTQADPVLLSYRIASAGGRGPPVLPDLTEVTGEKRKGQKLAAQEKAFVLIEF